MVCLIAVLRPHRENHVCRLTNTTGALSCSFKRSTEAPEQSDFPYIFDDIHIYEISLCHGKDGKSDMCELLDDGYRPVTNSKQQNHNPILHSLHAQRLFKRVRIFSILLSVTPNAPCCLTVRHNSSRYHFSWKNTYERYSTSNDLAENLKYELHFYKLENKHPVRCFYSEIIASSCSQGSSCTHKNCIIVLAHWRWIPLLCINNTNNSRFHKKKKLYWFRWWSIKLSQKAQATLWMRRNACQIQSTPPECGPVLTGVFSRGNGAIGHLRFFGELNQQPKVENTRTYTCSL